MKLYLSGPMTGIPEHNFPAFNAAAKELRAAGYDVVDPADRGIVPGWAWEDYLRVDLRDLTECEGVALLPGWRESKGASLEVFVAEKLKMPLWAVECWVARATATARELTRPLG